MDPIQSGANPTNNPRLDLLHNTGNNQQLRGAAGSYGPDATAFHQQGASPQPPAPAGPSKAAAAYIAAAQSQKPDTPVPMPPPPAPEPRPAPEPTHPNHESPPITSGGSGHKGLIIFLILLVLIIAGGGGYWWWTHRAKPAAAPASISVTPVTPTNLSQVDSSKASIDPSGTTKDSKVTFQFNVHTSANSGSLVPEIEVEPAGTPFTGRATITGQAVAASSNMQLTATSGVLTNGSYHWQARDSVGSQHSAWEVFGTDPSATAFTVDATAPTAPTVTSIGGVSIANPTVVTSNRPPIVGTAAAGATITVAVSPDSQKFTTTADSSGNWTVTPNTDIPNGQHQLSITATNAAGTASTAVQIALSVNPATAADTTPSPAASTPATSAPAASSSSTSTAPATAAATPAPSKNLALTGDNTTATSLASLAVMIMAAAGIAWIRRRYASA